MEEAGAGEKRDRQQLKAILAFPPASTGKILYLTHKVTPSVGFDWTEFLSVSSLHARLNRDGKGVFSAADRLVVLVQTEDDFRG